MPNFEEFDRRQAVNPHGPTVTLTWRGAVSFSADAWELLGSPRAIKLLYDAECRVVGFQSAEVGERNAYKIRANGSVRMVMATAFCRYIGTMGSAGESRRYPLIKLDGVRCIDLKEAGTLVTSNRAKASA